jgi:ADP-ribose pyrophosphatase YjhB (NUDIX family)
LQQDAVLLVQRRKDPDAGLWGFPGGHVEPGETGLAAAARELAEETGVIATPLSYLTNLDVIVHNDAGQLQFHYLLAVVLCRYESGAPQPADDALDARWVPMEEIATLPTSASVADVLSLAREFSDY